MLEPLTASISSCRFAFGWAIESRVAGSSCTRAALAIHVKYEMTTQKGETLMRKLLIVLVTLSLLGCTAETSDPVVGETSTMSESDARVVVEAQNEVFRTTFAAKDATGLANLYTVDGMVIPPDAPNAVGHEAIAAYWAPVMEVFASAVITTEEVFPAGEDRILERTSVQIFDADGIQTGNAKAMILWTREGDAWKMHRDIRNYGE